MRIFLKALIILSAGILGGCDFSATPTSDWQQIVKANGNACPDISGTFSIMDGPGYIMLGRHYEKEPKQWDTMSISGNAQNELNITLYEADSGVPYDQPIKRIHGEDYQCHDGWLETGWPYMAAPIDRTDEGIPDDALLEKTLSFAKNKYGELVMRSNTRYWKGIAVWCGDGCKYIPIPFTSRTHHQWSRWPTSTIPVAAKHLEEITPPVPEIVAPGNEIPEGRVKQLLSNLSKAGTKLIGLNPSKDGWRATFRGDTNSLIALQEALQTTANIQILDVKIKPLSSSQKEVEVEFKLPPTKAELETKQSAEIDRQQRALQKEAYEKDLVNRLLPSIPKNMIITATQVNPEGLLVELRHMDESAFYELITRAIASGEFIKADIKTRKAVDNYGKQVMDILFTPNPGPTSTQN